MSKLIRKEYLKSFYENKKYSVARIARALHCSQGKVNYWIAKYHIRKRTISEAAYAKHNPRGDPFIFRRPRTLSEAKLFGMGVGLYWGEGNKANKGIVKLGNSDPGVIKTFIKFLVVFFTIKKSDLRFHLQIFSDIRIEDAVGYWQKEIGFKRSQLYKPLITISGKLGTYRKKSQYGVLTAYYANTKLRNIMVSLLGEQY